jgi:putative ABC transport system substrate-binding protein
MTVYGWKSSQAKKRVFLYLLTTLLPLVIIAAADEPSLAETSPKKSALAILVSKNIKPYQEAVKGIKLYLEQRIAYSLDAYVLSHYNQYKRENLAKELQQRNYDLLISIGPEATHFLWSQPSLVGCPMLYTMVLSPDKLIPASKEACGLSLNIPISFQLTEILQNFPQTQRLGLLFSRQFNQSYYDNACRVAHSMGVTIVPMAIEDQRDLPGVMKDHWDTIDVLWLIPDKSLRSPKVFEYIIKEALYQKIPVIGYNRFFYESGAALSFIFDYTRLGKQTGSLALKKMRTNTCVKEIPSFSVKKNSEIMENMEID